MLGKALQPKVTKYFAHHPTPKQAAFLWLECEDAFYGGAAGGGKSDALLMAALQYVDCPKYAALLLRDSYTNLSMPGALMDRAEEWLGDTDARWEEKTKTWHFPLGASLTFGYLSGPKDHLNYKSSEFQFIGIDEATDIRWNQIKYMFSRLRRLEGSNIPLRFRLGSNPGGESHAEIKSKYIDPETREPGVIFIPSRLGDNKYLDRASYEKTLQNLDPITREQLLNGDWDVAVTGRKFRREWFQIIDKAPIEVQSIRFWDLAATEPKKTNKEPAYTCGVKMLKDKNNICYVEGVVRKQAKPLAIESLVRQCADMDGRDTLINMEQEPGSGGVNTIDYYRRNVLAGFSFDGYPPEGSKTERANPYASYAEAGNVYLVNGPWIKDYLDELELFPDGKLKDQVDASSGAFNKLFSPRGAPRAWSV